MEHKHIFKNIGGGCLMSLEKQFNCDDHYKCDCGLEFRLMTNELGHRFLPEQFEVQEMSEIKKAEQDAILNSKFN